MQQLSTFTVHGNSFHPFEHCPAFLALSVWGEGKVASYVTKRHFTAVSRLMYEDRNGQCWNSRPHTHTHRHTNTRLMDDTSIRSRTEALCQVWRRPAAATIRCFYWEQSCLYEKTHLDCCIKRHFSSSLKSEQKSFVRVELFMWLTTPRFHTSEKAID